MHPKDAAETIVTDMEAHYPGFVVVKPGGLTLRYQDEIARVAFHFMFKPEIEGSRHRLEQSSALNSRLAELGLHEWGFSFISREHRYTIEQSGRQIETGRKSYSLQIGVLPPLPE